MTQIHQTAIINKTAQIDSDVEIGPFTVIDEDVRIGKGTKIYNNVTILKGSRLGENNEVYPNAVIGANPQDLKFQNEYTEVFIGNNNKIRECVTINKGTIASFKTVIKDNCLLMAYSHVAHDCVLNNNVILANSVAIGGHVEIGDYAIIGGLCGIHQFVKIGAHCMLGAKSFTSKDIPPYSLFSGDNIKFSGLNIIGLRRRGFSNEAIECLTVAYKLLYKSGLNVSQALKCISEMEKKTPEIDYLMDFIKTSSRGIAK